MSQEKFHIRVIKINIVILLINTNILHFSLSKLTLNIVTLQCIRILQFFFIFEVYNGLYWCTSSADKI